MNYLIILALSFILIMSGLPVSSQDDPSPDSDFNEVTYECDNGLLIEDGVEVILVNVVSNLDYTVTVIGIDGFDPILAVIQSNGLVDCVDDSREANNFVADLPTTGFIQAQNRNSQIKFRNNVRTGLADVQVLVGGARQSYGEFLMIIEGMAVHQFADEGDIFSIRITDSLLASDIPPTAYAISIIGGLDGLDPVIYLVDNDGTEFVDENDIQIYCDDAGFSDICWGTSVVLDGYYVSRTFNRQVDAQQLDAMLTFDQPELLEDYVNFRIGSYLGSGFGDYITVLHIGFADPDMTLDPESTEEAEATDEAEDSGG
jgi:hypothetical protein